MADSDTALLDAVRLGEALVLNEDFLAPVFLLRGRTRCKPPPSISDLVVFFFFGYSLKRLLDIREQPKEESR